MYSVSDGRSPLRNRARNDSKTGPSGSRPELGGRLEGGFGLPIVLSILLVLSLVVVISRTPQPLRAGRSGSP